MDRAVLVCRKFADLARSYEAREIIAVATSAARDAHNQRELIQRLNTEAQLDLRVISGREEARLIYLGVASGVHLGANNAVFIDVGGGSTEMIVGNQLEYHDLDSLKLGAIRLTMQFLPGEIGPIVDGELPGDPAACAQHRRPPHSAHAPLSHPPGLRQLRDD